MIGRGFIAGLLCGCILAWSGCDNVATDDVQLEETEWRLIRVGRTTLEGYQDGQWPRAQFDSEYLTGHSGCNFFAASYHLDGERIILDRLRITQVYCRDDKIMELEDAIVAAFLFTKRWNVDGEELELYDLDGTFLMRFKASSATSS